MFKKNVWSRTTAAFSRILLPLAIVGILAAIVLFVWAVASIELSIGEIVGILGIWLTLGVLVGKEKERRGLAFVACYVMLFLVLLVYVIRRDSNLGEVQVEEVIGFFTLAGVGVGVGLIASWPGKGKDKSSEDSEPSGRTPSA